MGLLLDLGLRWSQASGEPGFSFLYYRVPNIIYIGCLDCSKMSSLGACWESNCHSGATSFWTPTMSQQCDEGCLNSKSPSNVSSFFPRCEGPVIFQLILRLIAGQTEDLWWMKRETGCAGSERKDCTLPFQIQGTVQCLNLDKTKKSSEWRKLTS